MSHSAEKKMRKKRVVMVSMKLPLSMAEKEEGEGWDFKVDEDALLVQACASDIQTDFEVIHVGCLPKEVPVDDQDDIAAELLEKFNYMPVFLGEELKQKYYNNFCKQTLWPLLHYLLPLSAASMSERLG